MADQDQDVAVTETQQDPPVERVPVSTSGNGKKMIPMPADAIGRMKAEQRERGRKEHAAELERRAKEAGFSSYDEALEAARASRQRAPREVRETPRNPEPQNRNRGRGNVAETRADARSDRRNDREAERWRKQLEESSKKARVEEKRRRQFQRQLEEKDVEMALRTKAAQAGVREIDFAIHKIREEMRGLPADQAGKPFDEDAYFKRLRVDQPYLFGEVERLATTGTSTSTKTAPTPASVAAAVAANGKFDAMTASPEALRDRLESLGIDNHGIRLEQQARR